ncbi:hypothetical protein [Lignipirellula cremea]|uniref:Thioredoxin domain-containing protein n=1 Tax=Lignipirellula cremea TaxID=2528010 RepID=A0A518DL68_9BACT|nr:hypothetical protein [Lignipirellula cremea]QDU92577.1 hypothetical protein Pla8534_03250 [Lignipirellula cremea]
MTRSLAIVPLLLFAALVIAPFARADEPVFSGPQPEEKLPPLKLQGVLGEEAGKQIDPLALAGDKSLLLIFFHQRTRPAFGLTNVLMKYAQSRRQDGLFAAVGFLGEDPAATEKWLQTVQRHLVPQATYAIAPGGVEGPGAFGLNRNVTLTVLLAKDGVTTASFALVQPSLPVDGQAILDAIAANLGDVRPAKIADISPQQPAARNGARPAARAEDRPGMSPDLLRSLLQPVIDKNATPAQVDAAAAKVEAAIAENPALGREIHRIATTIVNAGKLANYGTPHAQAKIKAWAEQQAPR